MPHQLVIGFAGGIHRDDERIHVTRRAPGCKAEVAQVAARSRFEALRALDLLHLIAVDVRGAQILVVVHERAKTHAQRSGDLDERRERCRQLAALQALDDRDVASATIRQIPARQMVGGPQGDDLLSEPVVIRHSALPFSLVATMHPDNYPPFACRRNEKAPNGHLSLGQTLARRLGNARKTREASRMRPKALPSSLSQDGRASGPTRGDAFGRTEASS